jgi:hypothetical protein
MYYLWTNGAIVYKSTSKAKMYKIVDALRKEKGPPLYITKGKGR